MVYIPIIMIILAFSPLWPRQIEPNPVVLKPIKTVYPKYPEHLKEEGIAGEVIVWAWIDEKGSVKIHGPVHRSLHPELDALATEAVKQWKYDPPLILGKSRGAWTYISIIFDPGELPEVEDSTPRKPLSDELLTTMTVTYEYDDDIKGILFPSRSKIVLDYFQLGPRNKRDTKMKLVISYDKYRFFTVETEPKIIKSSQQGLVTCPL
jgi:TonB family protein